MSTPRCRLTEAEREAQRASDRELTVRAVAQLRTSAGWQAWLRVRARTGCAATACLSRGVCVSVAAARCAHVDDMSPIASLPLSPGRSASARRLLVLLLICAGLRRQL